MTRGYFIPGLVFVTCAMVLSVIVSISLPFLTALDIVRIKFDTAPQTAGAGISELRLGVWANCYDTSGTDTRTCSTRGHGYSVALRATEGDTAVIRASWTRGLAVHPVAAAVTFVAFGLSFSHHITVTLVASFLSFLAALLTLIAFAIDIALLALVRNEMGGFSGVTSRTNPGPGFWLTFVSFILLLLSGCTVCLGRRRQRMAGASSYEMSEKKPFWKFWKRS